MKECATKYLRVTIHDNDFWYSLSLLADMLYEIFIGEGRFPEEDELLTYLKEFCGEKN